MTLYLIPTPIGNLGDITLRTIETLEKVEILLCEDTRVTSGLLDKLKIKNKPKLISYYQEVESSKLSEIVGYLEENYAVGLVADAGSPMISDPGWLLTKTCIARNFKVEALPGASSVITALQLSGLPTNKFMFVGFLPKKEGEKKKLLASDGQITKVAFESPERLTETIGMMAEDTEICVCREMTKMHEELVRGKRDKVLEQLKTMDPRGEVVLVWK